MPTERENEIICAAIDSLDLLSEGENELVLRLADEDDDIKLSAKESSRLFNIARKLKIEDEDERSIFDEGNFGKDSDYD